MNQDEERGSVPEGTFYTYSSISVIAIPNSFFATSLMIEREHSVSLIDETRLSTKDTGKGSIIFSFP